MSLLPHRVIQRRYDERENNEINRLDKLGNINCHQHRCVADVVGGPYSVSQKSSPPKTFCNIFTEVKYISVKFCQDVASLYLHKFTNFGRFILIFNKMALIFLGVPIILNVFSFKFEVSLSQIAVTPSPIMSGLQFIRPQSTGLSILGEMLESCYKLQPKLKTVPKFTDAL